MEMELFFFTYSSTYIALEDYIAIIVSKQERTL